MTTEDPERWTPAWLALIRTHARLWDQVEAQMRHDSGLTLPRYDVLMQIDGAGGRLGLTELASKVVLSPSGLSKLLDRMEAIRIGIHRIVEQVGRRRGGAEDAEGAQRVEDGAPVVEGPGRGGGHEDQQVLAPLSRSEGPHEAGQHWGRPSDRLHRSHGCWRVAHGRQRTASGCARGSAIPRGS